MNTELTGFDKIVKKAAVIRQALILDKSTMVKQILPVVSEDFVELFKTEGQSIGRSFPRDKKGGKPPEKYRKQKLPGELGGWQRGIWSGGTAFSMIHFTRADHANTTVKVEKGAVYIEINVPGKNGKIYVNVSIGLSDEARQKIKDVVFKIISQRIKKERDSYL